MCINYNVWGYTISPIVLLVGDTVVFPRIFGMGGYISWTLRGTKISRVISHLLENLVWPGILFFQGGVANNL